MNNYDELAARAERGELAVKPSTVRRGADAAAQAQRLLKEATGTRTSVEVARIPLGHPGLGTMDGTRP